MRAQLSSSVRSRKYRGCRSILQWHLSRIYYTWRSGRSSLGKETQKPGNMHAYPYLDSIPRPQCSKRQRTIFTQICLARYIWVKQLTPIIIKFSSPHFTQISTQIFLCSSLTLLVYVNWHFLQGITSNKTQWHTVRFSYTRSDCLHRQIWVKLRAWPTLQHTDNATGCYQLLHNY